MWIAYIPSALFSHHARGSHESVRALKVSPRCHANAETSHINLLLAQRSIEDGDVGRAMSRIVPTVNLSISGCSLVMLRRSAALLEARILENHDTP
jgi:hypothetical protein